jgi:ferric-dicitrate binding protein FerR (iron transport regulator)
MHTADEIKQFFKLLIESGLDEDRIHFWLSRFEKGEVSEADQKAFTRELEAHLAELDEAEEDTKMAIAKSKAQLKESEKEALPYLQKLSAKQPAYYKEQETAYKTAVLTAEKEMTGKIEEIRTGKSNEEIAAIRKMLKS